MQNVATISTLLNQARRRYSARVTVRQFALAAAGAAAAFVLLLLVGTQVLDWWWPAAIFGAALAFGIWRTWGRVPSEYAAAQTIDRELHLQDALSTAYAFRDADLGARDPLRLAQQAEAARAASGVDLAAVIPLQVPREAYLAAGLVAVALSLFGIRYGVLGTLDLKASLVDIAFDNFFAPDTRTLAKNNAQRPPLMPPGLEDADAQNSTLDTAQDKPLNADPQNDPDAREPEANADPKSQASGKSDQKEGNQDGGEQQQGKEGKPNEAEGKEGQEQKGDQGKQGKQGKQEQKPGDGKPGKQASESQSLMDKMRDALNNLVNKMKSEPKEGKENAQNQKQGQQQQGDKGKQQAKSDSGQNQQNAEAKNEQGQQGEQSSQQARANERSSDQAPSPDSKGGVGQQDGAKDAQIAEQLEAMGKISEILGKRQQTLSGEVMVEVQNSRQSLKTAYSNKSAKHAEAGGEVHRDEVPLVFQQYVQQYFEEIRKAPKAAKAAPARDGGN